VEEFPHLAHANVFAALAYYWGHKDDIDKRKAADDAVLAEMMRQHPGRLQEKLKQLRVG
jgi:hypothetical protein